MNTSTFTCVPLRSGACCLPRLPAPSAGSSSRLLLRPLPGCNSSTSSTRGRAVGVAASAAARPGSAAERKQELPLASSSPRPTDTAALGARIATTAAAAMILVSRLAGLAGSRACFEIKASRATSARERLALRQTHAAAVSFGPSALPRFCAAAPSC